MYPGLWRHALSLAKSQDLPSGISNMVKLEKAVEEKTGVPTYMMPGTRSGRGAPADH